MRKLLSTTAAMAVLGLSSAPAYAADYISGFNAVSESMQFGNDGMVCAGNAVSCLFNSVFNFATPTGYNIVGVSFSTNGVNGDNMPLDVDFLSGDLNGTPMIIGVENLIDGAVLQFGGLGQTAINGNPNTLTIDSLVWSRGSFSGELTFAKVAVPEPAAWLMMLLGFGLVGGMLRSRRQSAARVNFAF